MASAPSEPQPILGRVDRDGRLIAADPELERLQVDAGARLGERLALPQIAAIVRLARKLKVPVTRSALAADLQSDYEFSVRAIPEGEEVALSLEHWSVSPASGPRLSSADGPPLGPSQASALSLEWATDRELKLTGVSADLIELLGTTSAEAIGQPLTRVVRLAETEDGDMPLLAAVAVRQSFEGQPARTRAAGTPTQLILSGEAVTDADGAFAGFSGTATFADSAAPDAERHGTPMEQVKSTIDEALRTPLDQIVQSAQQIREGGDEPLRSDYAAYANDISTAARHLLSVITSMGGRSRQRHATVDLAALAAQSVLLLETLTEERNVSIVVETSRPVHAVGDERAVIQILVNLIGNAIRHSPPGETVTLRFARSKSRCTLAVSDNGPGIDPADQERIFERFERASPNEDGTGLGLAISRRLARMMGGDIELESKPGEGSRFTLALPSA